VIVKPVLPVVAGLIAMLLPVIADIIAVLLPVVADLVPVARGQLTRTVFAGELILESVAALIGRAVGGQLARSALA